jgi:hypothetical protein
LFVRGGGAVARAPEPAGSAAGRLGSGASAQ